MSQSPLKKGYIKNLNLQITQKQYKNDEYQTFYSSQRKQRQSKIYRFANVIQMKSVNELVYGTTSNGSFIIYEAKLSQQKKLNGRALIIYPQNIIISCQYKNGKLHRQCIIYCKSVFLLVLNYENGVLQQQQTNFSYGTQLLTKSQYKRNILQNISKSSITLSSQNQIEFKQFFKNKILLQKVQQVISYQVQWAKPAKIGKMVYYGQLNQQNIPEGLGLTFLHKDTSQMQIYFGNFKNGLLNGIGCISFCAWKNYFGQFQMGQFIGIGKYFQNNKCIFMDSKERIQQQVYIQLLLKYCFDKRKPKRHEQELEYIHKQFTKLTKIYSKSFESNRQKQEKNIIYEKAFLHNSANIAKTTSPLNNQRQIYQSHKENLNESDIQINSFNSTKRKDNQFQLQYLHGNHMFEEGKKKSIFKTNDRINQNVQQNIKNSFSFQNDQTSYQKNKKLDLKYINLNNSNNLLRKNDFHKLRKASTQILQDNQKQISWQQLSNDSNYVQKQYNFMVPNNLQIYPTFNKTQQLIKQQEEIYIRPQYMNSIQEEDEKFTASIERRYK